jgi:hypothetical protein
MKADGCRIKPEARTARAKQLGDMPEDDVDGQFVWEDLDNVVAATILHPAIPLNLLDTLKEEV